MKQFYFDSLSVLAKKEMLQTHENVVPMCLTISLWLQTETPFLVTLVQLNHSRLQRYHTTVQIYSTMAAQTLSHTL